MADPHAPAREGLVITRVFDAPRELVFRAWTEAERLAEWWGPVGFALEVLSLDVRPGGHFHYRMSNDSGAEMWGRFVYREVTAPERLVYVSSFSDAEGGITGAPFPGLENFPREVLSELTFTEQDGKTTLTLRGFPINASEVEFDCYEGMRASMNQGFNGTFAQLDAYLARAK